MSTIVQWEDAFDIHDRVKMYGGVGEGGEKRVFAVATRYDPSKTKKREKKDRSSPNGELRIYLVNTYRYIIRQYTLFL